jgi:polysaccharide biosynthesis transport protein
MPDSFLSLAGLTDLVRLARRHRKLWISTAALVTLMAVGYAMVRPATWEASQALIVRNEAVNNVQGLGKFGNADEMKTTQETILELAKSRNVLAAALAQVGPADGPKLANWPSEEDVAVLAEGVKLMPPKGAEFGKTEVFYLKVKDSSRQRAIALAAAISDQLQNHFQKLRDAKAQSMIAELNKTVALAQADLARTTNRLATMEREIGGDLAELRILNDSPSADSDLRRTITGIENELRQAQVQENSDKELLRLLSAARDNPGALLATPSRLLESQPALKQLKEGLVAAQLRTAQLLGSMSEEHPQVQAARATETEIGVHLHDELGIAMRGVEVDLRLATERMNALDGQLGATRKRLDRLVGVRAQYANLAAGAKHRAALLEAAERSMADARASQAGAHSASLLSVIDGPDTGTNPVGPSRALIVAAGLAGGLLSGFGLVFLAVQPARLAPVSEGEELAANKANDATRPSAGPAAPVDHLEPAVHVAAFETCEELPPMAHAAAEPIRGNEDGLSLKQALQKIARNKWAWN